MKTAITIIAMCMATASVVAQENAAIEVSYSFESPNFKTAKREIRHQYILRANSSRSKFFSPKTEYIDSLKSTPEGAAKLNEMSQNAMANGKYDDIPRPDGSFYIVKSSQDNKLRYYDTVCLNQLVSEEPIPEIAWEICDSANNVLGYDCEKATCTFHGRKWTAWFTPEIPIQNGPWKLSGLPGLILEAESADGMYLFTATGLEQTSNPIGSVYLADQYEKVDRTEMLKAKRAFFDNPLGQIHAQLEGPNKTVSTIDEHGNSISMNERLFAPREEVDFIETDY